MVNLKELFKVKKTLRRKRKGEVPVEDEVGPSSSVHTTPGQVSPEHPPAPQKPLPPTPPTVPPSRHFPKLVSTGRLLPPPADSDATQSPTYLRAINMVWDPSFNHEDRELSDKSLSQLKNLYRPFVGPLRAGLTTRPATYEELEHFGGGAQPGLPAFVGEIVLGKFLMQGRIWSAFQATGTVRDPNGRKVKRALIAKFALVDNILSGRELAEEASFYLAASHLQGTVVPHHHGVYFAQQTHVAGGMSRVFCVLMDDAGVDLVDRKGKGKEVQGGMGQQTSRLFPDDATLEPEERHERAVPKANIVKLYRELHTAGVVHNSPNPKHWLMPVGRPDRLRLIDFGRADLRPAASAGPSGGNEHAVQEWRYHAMQERAMVCELVGLPFVKTYAWGSELEDAVNGARRWVRKHSERWNTNHQEAWDMAPSPEMSESDLEDVGTEPAGGEWEHLVQAPFTLGQLFRTWKTGGEYGAPCSQLWNPYAETFCKDKKAAVEEYREAYKEWPEWRRLDFEDWFVGAAVEGEE